MYCQAGCRIHLDEARTLEIIGNGRVTIQLEAFLKDKQHKSTFLDAPNDHYFEVIKVPR